MTAVEMVNKFYDVLENTSTAFSTTRMRPVVDVVLQYLNEAQIVFFNERYLPGDILTNINTIKLLRAELLNLVEEYTVPAKRHTTKENHLSLEEDIEGIFIEGFIQIHHTLLDLYDMEETEEGKVEEKERFTTASIIPITLDSVGKFLTNHTNNPILVQPVIALGSAGEIEGEAYRPNIIVDSMTTVEKKDNSTKVYITTVKLPTKINIRNESTGIEIDSCKLHPRFHESITRTAVDIFLREKGAFANQERTGEEK